MPNCQEFLYVWLGLSHIGGIIVPVNIEFRERETSFILRHSDCVAFVGNGERLGVIGKIRTDLPNLQYVISTEDKKTDLEILAFNSFQEESPDLKDYPCVKDDDISSIMYTSGTTGPPKGVLVTHRAYVYCGQGYKLWAEITDQDRLFTCLPLYHANAQYYSTMGSLAAGASLILVNRFSASKFWDQIRYYGVTIFNFIGAMLAILMKQPESPQDSQNPVRVAYGTPALEKKLQESFEKRFGVTLLFGYALTECPFGTIQPLHGVRRPKSIGLPRYHPDFENKIIVVDEQDRELPSDKIGEIVINNPTVTPGYFRDPEETNRVIKNGWLHTGDTAYRDKDGYFYFVDRIKDVIRRRGENFSSLEIEEVLNSHPKILESAIIGVPSELTDEDVKAFVVLKPAEVVSPEEIFRWCEERLARFKVPRFLELCKSLPKTPTHRVEKYKLREDKNNLGKGCVDRENMPQ